MNNTTDIDLFEQWELLPIEIQQILHEFNELDSDYRNCAKLVDELESNGYTCDYGLDCEPFNLQKI